MMYSGEGGSGGARPNRLSQEQLETLEKDGFIVLHYFFSVADDLLPVLKEFDQAVDDLAKRLLERGLITRLHDERDEEDDGLDPVYTRLSKIEKEFDGAPQLIHKMGQMGPALARLWTHPRLLDVVQQIMDLHRKPDSKVRCLSFSLFILFGWVTHPTSITSLALTTTSLHSPPPSPPTTTLTLTQY